MKADGTVVEGENGLELSYKTTHFSWWNFGFKVEDVVIHMLVKLNLNSYPGLSKEDVRFLCKSWL